MKKNKVELYEVLSNHLLSEGQAVVDPLDESALLSRQRSHPPRSGREIIFSLDAAFIIFVVVLLLIGTAFFMGLRQGAAQARMEFTPDNNRSVPRERSHLDIIKESPDNISGSLTINSGKFTLRLLTLPKTPENLAKLRTRQQALMTTSLIEANHLDVLLFEKGQNYLLSVGLFDNREGDALKVLKDFFKEGAAGASAEFRDTSVESTSDLGTPVS